MAAVNPNCKLYGNQGYTTLECQLLVGLPTDRVNYAQGNPYSNTYNPGWSNHPNVSYRSNNALFAPNPTPNAPLGYQKPATPTPPSAPKKSNLELLMENFISTQTQQNKEFMNQNIHTNELVKHLATKVDALATNNKILETQITQVAQQQAKTNTPARVFPGQPEPNPKGHANAITLRSGTEYDGTSDPRLQNRSIQQNLDEETEKKNDESQLEKPANKEGEIKEGRENEKSYVSPLKDRKTLRRGVE